MFWNVKIVNKKKQLFWTYTICTWQSTLTLICSAFKYINWMAYAIFFASLNHRRQIERSTAKWLSNNLLLDTDTIMLRSIEIQAHSLTIEISKRFFAILLNWTWTGSNCWKGLLKTQTVYVLKEKLAFHRKEYSSDAKKIFYA